MLVRRWTRRIVSRSAMQRRGGAPDPPRLLPAHDDRIERAADKLAAFEGVLNAKISEIDASIAKCRPGWAKSATRRIIAEQRRYEQALVAMVEARGGLVLAGQYARWLDASPEPAPGFPDGLLASKDRRAPAEGFEKVIDKPREDAERLPMQAPAPGAHPGVVAALRRAYGDDQDSRLARAEAASWSERR
jgi:hypothetical protein